MGAGHHHVDPDSGNSRIFWAIVVNFALTIVQIAGGLLSGSLALVADAIHNLSDAFSLVIAFLARKIARNPADDTMTYGYRRAEIVAALVNYTTLVVIGLYLVYEAFFRLFNPENIEGWTVIIIACIALAIDTVTALLTYSLSKNSVNIRAAFLHNVTDALGSVAVIISGTLILLYDWRMIDSMITLLIAGYILWQSFFEIGSVIKILMLAAPPGINAKETLANMQKIDGVAGVHHLHLWQMQEYENALDAHIVIEKGKWNNADSIKFQIKEMLKKKFLIRHSTLEMECTAHACVNPKVIGHEENL